MMSVSSHCTFSVAAPSFTCFSKVEKQVKSRPILSANLDFLLFCSHLKAIQIYTLFLLFTRQVMDCKNRTNSCCLYAFKSKETKLTRAPLNNDMWRNNQIRNGIERNWNRNRFVFERTSVSVQESRGHILTGTTNNIQICFSHGCIFLVLPFKAEL